MWLAVPVLPVPLSMRRVRLPVIVDLDAFVIADMIWMGVGQ